MTQRGWYEQRLVHSCTVTRDTGTARSSSGQPLPVGSAVSTAQTCRYAVQSNRYGNERMGFVFVRESWLQLPYNADVLAGDAISSITDSGGTAIVGGTFNVDEFLARRDIHGNVHHQSAKLVKTEVS